jgi:hypothetical protein
LKRRKLIRILIITFILTQLGMASVFVVNEFLHFTSSNSAIYFVRGEAGGFDIKRDLFIEDADRLIFKIDFNGVFAKMKRELAVARHKPTLELTWDRDDGVGGIKSFRPDGTILSMAFSRYRDDVGPVGGLFLGGDLSVGDSLRSEDSNTSGFGYFDGKDWFHIWCASNEGFSITGTKTAVVPSLWKYLGSRVLKNTQDEVMVESRHETTVENSLIRMTRLVSMKADEDYFVLRVKFTNASPNVISYNYAYGDEPWIGRFGTSEGDVGWYDGGVVNYEKFISPVKHSYAGFWDIGNDAANEGHDGYTGYANFVEWLSPTPSYVFFANSFEDCCDESTSLSDEYNRILDIVWLNHMLMPGESRDHTMAVGMAKVDDSGSLPVKPEVVF